MTGASDSVSYNLAQGQRTGNDSGIDSSAGGDGKIYDVRYLTPCQGPYGTGCSAYTAAALLSQDLADVSGQDVKSGGLSHAVGCDAADDGRDHVVAAVDDDESDGTCRRRRCMCIPGGYETTAMQGIAEGVPYNGARGALKEDLGVKDTYATDSTCRTSRALE